MQLTMPSETWICDNSRMIGKLTNTLRLALALLLMFMNTLVHVLPLLVIALMKMIIRIAPITRLCDRWLIGLAQSWIAVNSRSLALFTDTVVQVVGLPQSSLCGHFLVLCNHQSWVDIPVLQSLFNRRLPLLRFFLKRQLIWVPLLGLAWWALDFPFMRRHSKAELAKKPGLAGRDLAATRQACEKFKHIPVSIMNFVEGTRFTQAKHDHQASPYRHLLKPRGGGTALVLDVMGEQIDTIVDVTLVYPRGKPGFLQYLGNKVPEIRVHIRLLPVPTALRGGNYQQDAHYRQQFQVWLNQLWQEKDERIGQLLSEPS